ncbi:type II secretion system protein N [Vibrio sp. ZSDE26]|uniref:Type II secretion system protein N n=1 Tax=Vibrio amylolyticus TaxID=2847292 RepID=A0A9X1XJL6_9VIBR|nr:type II secretion system protein N [Vibrio amylolyticus]MCK6263310.1 type II secretion system protein N [Vibrio amylolyticus]
MKRIILASLIILMTLLISIVVHMPAQFVLQFAPLPRGLEIQGVQGSVWQGSVKQVSWQGNTFGQLQWTLHPSQLLLGKAQADVRFGQGSAMGLRGRGTIGYGLSGAYASDTIASVPAQFAIDQLSLPLPIDLEGQVELSISKLVVSDLDQPMPTCQQGEGAVVWGGNNVTTPIAELVLGPVVVNIQCQESAVTLKGKQGSEQVSAEFDATLDVNANGQIAYQAKGWFKPESEFPATLSSQLKWLGNPDNQGRYPQSFNGRL